jgi:hypothetical protein
MRAVMSDTLILEPLARRAARHGRRQPGAIARIKQLRTGRAGIGLGAVCCPATDATCAAIKAIAQTHGVALWSALFHQSQRQRR